MKKSFTREYILQHKGCYTEEQVLNLFKENKEYSIDELLSLDFPIRDKAWWIRNACELSTDEFRNLAIGCALVVLPIYESKYPENKAPREAIEAAKKYLAGELGIEELREKRRAAAAYAAAAYAADASAYAAYAADYAAAYAADYAAADAAAYAAYAADYAADYAAYAGKAVTYKEQLLFFFKEFFKQGL